MGAHIRIGEAEKNPDSQSLSLTNMVANPYRAVSQRAVIFLDIDGVLNRSSRSGPSKDHVVDTDLLAHFRSLVASTNSCVVLASTWRHEPAGVQKARDLGVPFEDVLPDLRPQSRGKEIKAWLAEHPSVERFIILDDDDDEYEDMPLFQPNPYKGLTDQVARAIEDYVAGRRDDDWRRSLLTRACQYMGTFFKGHRG